MTRIKKRRTGKKRTTDQLRKAAGRRKSRAVAKEETVKDQLPKTEPTAAQKAAYKKSFQPAQSNRRNRSSQKEKPVKNIQADNKKQSFANAASTGKTRSAGSRRVAVAKSVASNNNNKPSPKKNLSPKKEGEAEKKPSKGFAPWNKNKFRKK